MHKTGQSGGFLWSLLGPLLKTGLPLMTNLLKPLAKNILITLWLTEAEAETSATDTAIHKKMFGSCTKTVIILNEEVNDTMEIVKCLEESSLLIENVNETIKNEAKEQKRVSLSILLGTLAASLLENLLTGKGKILTD